MSDQERQPGAAGPGAEPADPLIGEKLGPYRIVSLIGAGGMGAVYLGVDEALERKAALKVLSLLSPRWMARFIAEARHQARLDHPNIVSVYGAGSALVRGIEVHYIALKFIEGSSLAGLVRRQGPFDPVQATELILDAARGLNYVHSEGFIHRDVKPSNILVDLGERALISDFGVSRGQSSAAGEPATGGEFLGTWTYAAPEQIARRPLDGRSDIYSLGATYLFALTGVELQDEGPRGPDPAKRLAGIDPALPAPVRHTLTRMLQVEPQDRFPSMLSCLEALERALAALSAGAADGQAAEPGASAARAGRGRLATAGRIFSCLLAALTVAAVFFLWRHGADSAGSDEVVEVSPGPGPAFSADAGPGLPSVDAPFPLTAEGGAADPDARAAPESAQPAPAAPSGPSPLALEVADERVSFLAEVGEVEQLAAGGAAPAEVRRRVSELLSVRLGQLDRRAYEQRDTGAALALDELADEIVPRLAAVLDGLVVGPVESGGLLLEVDAFPVTILQFTAYLMHVTRSDPRRSLAPFLVPAELTSAIWVEFQSPRRFRRPRYDFLLDPVVALSPLGIDEVARYAGKRVPTKQEWEEAVAPLLAAGTIAGASAGDAQVKERVIWDGDCCYAALEEQGPLFQQEVNVGKRLRGLRLVREAK
ncbi:MAG: serine/threonine protein kinase [Planctomycetes bacterium]|nr:serine/threonine protein kinase [Planctomycetota bacterium]